MLFFDTTYLFRVYSTEPGHEAVMARLESVLSTAPASTNIRAVDALHLACAAKKQKVAQLLTEADLAEEAEPHSKAAEKALAEAEAIESQ